MRQFRISFQVGEDALTTIISLLTSEVKDIKVEEVARLTFPKRGRGRNGGRSIDKQELGKFCLSLMSIGPTYSSKDFEEAVVREGWSKNSIISTLNALARAKFLEKTPGKDQYRRVK